MRFSFYALPCLLGLSLATPVPPQKVNERDLVKKNTPLNIFLSVLLAMLPAVDGTITALSGVLTDFEKLLVKITGETDTYNGLGGACRDYTLIFARGTTEPGNVGILVGPPLIHAIQDRVGSSKLTVQGVNNYAASVAGYLAGGDKSGSAEM